ncbi:MAG: divalent metal cation transporter [Planctomycetia bacterium]|nr:divalent metal cation transporter [Planctomycetia bacterium]
MNDTPRQRRGVSSGAAFLMAVSAIGPGFLTQTTQFTFQFGASLAFAILVSLVIDIGGQLNTWRVIAVSGKRGNEVADAVLPGLGWVITAVVIVGSFIFNLGNLSGCALALNALLGWPMPVGATLSALLAVVLFLLPRMLTAVDWFAKVLGIGMIVMTCYMLFVTAPPIGEAARHALTPTLNTAFPAVTLVGGTIGGYIMFSGAHRLLDGGISGVEQLPAITWASVQGILITGVMRVVVFLAVLGVTQTGVQLSPTTPVFDAFRAAAGNLGFLLAGSIFWAAAITSVVGCGYTSISFLRLSERERLRAGLIIGFIIASLTVTLALQLAELRATTLLIGAATINGVLMPVTLGTILLAAYRRSLMGEYRQPAWATAFGLVAWVGTVGLAGVLLYPLLT